MSKEGSLGFSVSTLSCASAEMPHDLNSIANVVVPSYVTEAMGRNTVELLDHLSPVFGRENMSASLHAGVVVNARQLVAQLEQAGYPLSSYDLSDKKTVGSLVGNLSRLAFAAVTHREASPSLHREPTLAGVAHELGWFLHNAPLRLIQERQLEYGLAVTADNAVQIVKTSADKFRSGADSEGIWLRDKLTAYKQQTGANVVLALEIHADYFSPAEYFALIERLAAENDRKVPIALDIDTGHIAQSREFHTSLQTTNQIVEDVFRDPHRSRMVAIVSMNQYNGGAGAHEKPNQGMIDIPLVAEQYGQAARADMLGYSPLALTEFYPKEREWFMTGEGVLFCSQLKQRFDGE